MGTLLELVSDEVRLLWASTGDTGEWTPNVEPERPEPEAEPTPLPKLDAVYAAQEEIREGSDAGTVLA